MFFKASSAPPPPAPSREAQPRDVRRSGRGWEGGGETMEICGWRGGKGEREILYSLLLQQQLQLHLIRRHQRYFCNRSPLALCVCVCPSLIYSPDCSAGGGGRQAGYGLLKREEERRGESWRWADRSRLLPSLPAAEESRGGERGRAPGPVAAALLTRQPRNSPGRAGRSRPRRRAPAPPAAGLRAAPPSARTLFLKPLRALF